MRKLGDYIMENWKELLMLLAQSVLPLFIISGLFWFIIKWVQTALMYLFGDKFSLILLYLGVPIHEFAHWFYAKVFLHTVIDVKLIDIFSQDNSLGSVTTTKNPYSSPIRKFYMNVGNFFVGLAPVLLSGQLILLGIRLLDNQYFINLFEHPTILNFLAMPPVIIVILVFFNLSVFNLSDSDFIATLKGYPYYIITVIVIILSCSIIGKLHWATYLLVTLQLKLYIVLVYGLLCGIGLLLALGLAVLVKLSIRHMSR